MCVFTDNTKRRFSPARYTVPPYHFVINLDLSKLFDILLEEVPDNSSKKVIWIFRDKYSPEYSSNTTLANRETLYFI